MPRAGTADAAAWMAGRSSVIPVARSRASLPIVATVVVLFAASGGLLWDIGINYEGLTGSAASKIHPFTYMVVLLSLWRMLTSGNLVGYGVRAAQVTPASLFLILVTLGLFVHIVVREAPGMAWVVDTFIGPALLLMLLAATDERAMRHAEIALHVLMTINALMGLYEFLAGTLIFPYRFDGEVFPFDARSTALQGHPLSNAAITACYVLALMTGGRSLPKHFKLPLIGLQAAALVVFGGRTAMVVVLVLGGIYGLFAMRRVLQLGRVPLLSAAIAVILFALLPIAVAGLAGGGFFDSILKRFASDGGSANARIEMFDLFSHLTLGDLIVGPDTDLVDSMRRVNGLEWGIENPIIKTILYQGVFMTVFLTIAVCLFFREIARFCDRGIWLPMIGFVILLNSAEMIGGKTTILAKFVVILLCMYRPVRSAAAPDPEQSSWPDQRRAWRRQ
jgi:hypothetical protein